MNATSIPHTDIEKSNCLGFFFSTCVGRLGPPCPDPAATGEVSSCPGDISCLAGGGGGGGGGTVSMFSLAVFKDCSESIGCSTSIDDVLLIRLAMFLLNTLSPTFIAGGTHR